MTTDWICPDCIPIYYECLTSDEQGVSLDRLFSEFQGKEYEGDCGLCGERRYIKPEKRTRTKAKANEEKDIEKIIEILNDTNSRYGKRMRREFYNKFGMRVLSARRSEPNTKKKAGSRSIHFDFQIQTEEGWFNVEHKGSQKYVPIDCFIYSDGNG